MFEGLIIKSVIFLAGICIEDAKNLKSGKLIVGMIAFLLLNAGCKNTSVNNLCLWAKPITITESELNSLSEKIFRQIDNFNQEFEEICNK